MSVAKQTIELIRNKQYDEAFNLNINLAKKVGEKFIPGANKQFVDLDDLFQEAYIGLWAAIHDFNPDKGCYFSTFAYKAIDNHLKDVVNGNTKKHRPVTPEPYSDLFKLEDTLIDNKSLGKAFNNILFSQVLSKIKNLSFKEAYFISSMCEGLIDSEIADKTGCSQQNVTSVKKRALSKLKDICG